ncbi:MULTISPECIES: hypothetical protein [unclassified Streptomyces]|uniref:hypothetical protein n=1 Tax=unclassified Streptomyces TaxID=2593676 RepID=UPI002E0E4FF4|nr:MULTISPECIES: hypothetical protein [unclassified Streptomyces]WSR26151.1 hypothetical protein OG573_08370 [Streptomyces sp. NBC_01205]
MPGHPVHPVQPAQPTPSVRSARTAQRTDARTDTTTRFTPATVHPSVRSGRRPHDDPAGDVVRWAAFSCLLVPVVLVVYGTSYGGAAVATLGLTAVTAACRAMLRYSEKAERAALVLAEGRMPPGGRRRHSRAGSGARPRSGGRARRGCYTSGGISQRTD